MDQLPDYLRDGPALPRMAEQLGATLGVANPPYVSIAGGRFTLIDGDQEEAITTYVAAKPYEGVVLDCMIIDANSVMSKIYYNKKYDMNAQHYEPPTCWSDNGQAPSASATIPQSATCPSCKWFPWGSKISEQTGKEVKACQDYQKLALIPFVPGEQAGTFVLDSTVFLLRCPPNSLKNLRAFNDKFKNKPIDVRDVITRIWFVPGMVGLLNFQPIRLITLEERNQRNPILIEKRTDDLVGRNDRPRQGALPPPAQPEQITSQAGQTHQPSYTPSPMTTLPPPQEVIPPTRPTSQAPQTQQPATQAPPQQQTAPAAPQSGPAAGRKPRTRKTAAAEPGNGQAPPEQPAQAPFRPQTQVTQPQTQPQQPAAEPNPPAAAPAAQPQQNFGMAPATAPDATVSAGLDGLFNIPGV